MSWIVYLLNQIWQNRLSLLKVNSSKIILSMDIIEIKAAARSSSPTTKRLAATAAAVVISTAAKEDKNNPDAITSASESVAAKYAIITATAAKQ